MAKDAYRFIIPLLVVLSLSLWGGLKLVSILLLLLILFIAFFFRDPERTAPSEKGAIVSPADGKVVDIGPGNAGEGATKLSIFLSVFDVHINRSPVDGRVASTEYKTGKFLAAFKYVASHENEQNVLTIDHGAWSVTVKQIAGLIARRIVCWKKTGDALTKGERIGMIRFGSRVDLGLPAQVEIRVKVGDKVKGGETIIGTYRE